MDKREIPILFSTPMVRAILDDRKTMTRRVIKPQPIAVVPSESSRYKPPVMLVDDGTKPARGCPYRIGDILWVREKWHVTAVGCAGDQDMASIEYAVGGAKMIDIPRGKVAYYASKGRWQPSIFLPRAAARLFLEVTDVRVERLRDITPADKIAEGFCDCCCAYPCSEKDICTENCFMKFWDSLHAKTGHLYHTNPWVWAVSFRKIEDEEEK
jgi:hypothetical protein